MNAFPEAPTLVIGVGNFDRGDDAVGLVAARHVKRTGPAGVTVIEVSADGAGLMELWKNAAGVIVIDAVQGHEHPGTIYRFDAAASPLPARSFRRSTHAFGLAEGIELSRTLHHLPRQLIVYGIAGRRFDLGSDLDPSVAAAAREVARRVLQDLASGLTAS